MHHEAVSKTFNVSGMHCASCANTITRQLEKLDGVESCSVNVGTEKAKVVFDPAVTSVSSMNHAVQPLGYTLESAHSDEHQHQQDQSHSGGAHEGHDMMTPISSDQSVKERKMLELEQLRKQVVILFPLLVVSILVMVWDIGADPLGIWPVMPEIVRVFVHHLLPIFATYTLFVIGLPYLKGITRFIKHRVANMDTLVGIGTLTAFLYSFLLTGFEKALAPYLNTEHTYYDVTIVVIGFITIGKYLESRSKLKTGEAIEKLLGLQAKSATVLRDGQQREVPIEEVVIGDIVVVKPGQKIPVDGEITQGTTSIDEAMITGEPLPVDKKTDDVVIGSTINKQGAIQFRATKVGSDTLLAQIITMVEEAQSSKAPIEQLADRISAVFVPVVLVFAALVLAAWLLVGPQFLPFSQALTLGIQSFVGILVIACPCAMGLATPTAVIVGVGKAAQHGILIKNAESLQKLDTVNFIVMDKTGTITKGTPAVTEVQSDSQLSEKEVLRLLRALEQHSEHPLAQAILEKAETQHIAAADVTEFAAIEGKGVRGIIDSQLYYAGNLKLAEELALEVDSNYVSTFTAQGKTPILLMNEKKVLAYVAVSDTLKDDAKEVVSRLHQQGMKVALLTGDHKQTAKYIAHQVGIDQVIAEVLPGEKAAEIKKLQAQGYVVAMVGDGVNDAPALATADVGIAMGTGTDVAIESAGVTLLSGHISKLPQALTLAHATMQTIKQNLFWAFFYNVVGIPVAAGLLYPVFGILLNPVIAGAAMAFSSVSVVLNALRLKSVKL